jgi:hypothetical protein
MRWTKEHLLEDEEVLEFVLAEVLSLVERWSKVDDPDGGIDLNYTYEFFDWLPASMIVNTYFNRFRHGNENKELFAEQVVLPYCIERGLIKKTKNGSYVDNSKAIEQMPELDFPD